LPKNKNGNLLLFLDQITDPQNLGSIVRSSLFLGVNGIIANKKNFCPLTPAVSKVSSGATEFMDFYTVKFLKPFF
jgi:21S rRNA (GM2251-2'-O)-methyltransferase